MHTGESMLSYKSLHFIDENWVHLTFLHYAHNPQDKLHCKVWSHYCIYKVCEYNKLLNVVYGNIINTPFKYSQICWGNAIYI